MTREEQLDWLCRLRSEVYVYMPKEWLIPMKNALDMTIKELEQKPTTKNDLGVDAVSRQAVRDTIYVECSGEKLNIDFAKVLLLQRAIKSLPSVKPQEPKSEWEHDHEILKAYSNGSNEVLDKIRAEIEKTAFVDANGSKYIFVNRVNQIIDKYRKESEG